MASKVKLEMELANRLTGEKLQVIDSYMVGTSAKPCIICKEPTVFIDIVSEAHICSRQCDKELYGRVEAISEEMDDVL